MNFDFINDLRLLLLENNIFMFVITGSKALALVFITFKFLDGMLSNLGDQNIKLNSMTKYIAYAFFIVISDFIPDMIENTFSVVDSAMAGTSSDLYTKLNDSLVEQWETVTSDCEDWMDYIGVIFSSITFVIFYIVACLLMVFCKIADLSMTSAYLLIRIFLLQFMKFVFPIIIALSALDSQKDLLAKWIRKYIGLFILGIAYIAIIRFCDLVQTAVQKQFTTSAGNDILSGMQSLNVFSFGMIITIVLVFTVKVKLFSSVTSFVSNLF